MTTVTERRIVREADREPSRTRSPPPDTDSKLSGILKGGKFWKTGESPQTSFSEADDQSDEVDKRYVRFYENHDGNRTNDQPEQSSQEADTKEEEREARQAAEETPTNASQDHMSEDARVEDASSPDCTELTLTFKLGQHHVLVDSLQRPNSAVRQLFPVSSNVLVQHRPTSEEQPASQDVTDGEDGDKRNEAGPRGGQHQFLVTADSLRMFEEAKKAKLAQFYGTCGGPHDQHGSKQSLLVTSDTDEDGSRSQIRRTIERNTLRRSLLRYEPGNRNRLRGGASKPRAQQNEEESLEERIRRLTCDLDEEETEQNEEASTMVEEMDAEDRQECEDFTEMPPRTSPQGEETRKQISTDSNAKVTQENVYPRSTADKATSPSSASVTSSSSTGSSTYKKLTDLFARRNNTTTDMSNPVDWSGHSDHQHHHHHHHHHQGIPLDLGNGLPAPATSPGDQHKQGHFVGPKCAVSRTSVTSEARKQFLSTLAPLAACVTSGATHEEQEDGEGENGGGDYYHQQVVVTSPLSVAAPVERMSIASNSTMAGEEEYSLDDIDEALAKEDQKGGAPQPDVVAGTPGGGVAESAAPSVSSPAPVDELALFVEQDAGRIERIKKRYSDTNSNDDDEHDDYGFNRRPSVRGIKPRFGSTTEILQQMQSQLQPPPLLACPARSHVTWPYQENPEQSNSPTGENCPVPRRRVPLGRGTVMPPVQEELGSIYGNYSPTRILQAVSPTDRKDRRYMHHVMYPYQQQLSPSTPPQQIMRIGGGCADYHQLGTRTPPIQHLQYPTASNSPPPSGIPRNYPAPNDAMTSVIPTDGSTPPPVQYHHFPGGFQSLDRNSSNLVTYGRRMTPPSGVVQMRISPVTSTTSPVGLHHHQPPPAHAGGGVVKLSTFNDPSLTAIIEPHYSVMPQPQASSSSRSSPITTTSVIRVGHGQQQTIRVPYPSGTPVQVHLLTRSGNESPQRGSPLLATRPQYVVARGTQTPALPGAIGSLYQVPPNARYYTNGAYMRQYLPDSVAQLSTSPQQGRGPLQYIPDPNSVPQALSPGSMPGPRPYMVDGPKPPQSSSGGRVFPEINQPNFSAGKVATSPVPAPTSSVPVPFNAGSPTRTAATSGERGVPEGAASCSPSFPQDAIYQQVQSPATSAPNNNNNNNSSNIIPESSAATTSVYYAMNV
ncbi:hypothetical protein B7P43_G12619 [Cryptotermes secundus]|uniref:Uncharacterized protein n=2 Tax=Cryptotermes secundus TaxID=105785 RepID=A0A2J7QKH5_9NEOP|nr:hypothetical protein B7P43_G12619 [Cryptotermes secundus]PNF29082.1 hypothetical protein B7P43_G12619 [Cryptotermes secundus]